MYASGGIAEGRASRYGRLLEVQALMARVSREVGPALDLDAVLNTVLGALRELVACDGGCIAIVDGDHSSIAASDPPFNALKIDGPTFTSTTVQLGTTVRAGDLPHDHAAPPESRAAAVAAGVHSLVCAPLVCLGETIGALCVYSRTADAFDDDHVMLLEGLATQVAGAIESARRYRTITELETLKSDFVTRVSHELRTPITIMSGFVSMLLADEGDLDAEARRGMLERVDSATARLTGLIDQLLMLSRLEAGVVAASIESVDAAASLDDVRRQAIAPDAITIECPEGLRYRTDRALLVRGLDFVVDNALKYAGACTIVATPTEIAVIDDGPGIAEAERSRVFEQFTRATDRAIPGMGIGLPMARTLLAAAGAELSIEDADDAGGCRVVARWV